MILKLNYFL